MKTRLALAVAAATLVQANAATYLLLSQTNALAAGITNEAKAYADSLPTGSTNWVDSGTTNATLAGNSTQHNVTATNVVTGNAGVISLAYMRLADGSPLFWNNGPVLRNSGTSILDLLNNVESAYAQLRLGSAIITNSAAGTTPLTINHASGATAPGHIYSVGGTRKLEFGAAGELFIYNTYTDASNYERAGIGWIGNEFDILSKSMGSGAARHLKIGTVGATILAFVTANIQRWQVNASGHLIAVTDNTYDIGAAAATRPRSVFVAPSGGFGSSATNTTMVVSATGATNTLSVNTVLYVTAATGASLTDNAGTTEFSGVTIANFTPIRMQPGGKFVATGVTYATGTSSHAW